MIAPRNLYTRSVAAAKRYWGDKPRDPAERNLVGKAIHAGRREAYRTGWMIGFRAGMAWATRKKP